LVRPLGLLNQHLFESPELQFRSKGIQEVYAAVDQYE